MGHADRWRSAALIGAAAGIVVLPVLGGVLFLVVLARSAPVRPGFGGRLALATAAALVLVAHASGPTLPGLVLAGGLAALAPLTHRWSSVARPGDPAGIALGLGIGAAAHGVAALATAQGAPIVGLAAHQNVLGALGALAVPSMIALARGRPARAWWRWTLVLGVLGVVAATGSRGAMVAALAGAAWMAVDAARAVGSPAPRRSARTWAWVGAVGAVVAVLALWVGVRQPSSDELLGLTGRTALWGIAVELVAERPVLGHGPWAWARLADLVEPSVRAERFPHSHSGYLELAITYGLVGLAVVVAYFVSIVHALGRLRTDVWAAAARATWLVFAIVNVGDAFVIDGRFVGLVVLVSGAAPVPALSPPAPTPPRPTA